MRAAPNVGAIYAGEFERTGSHLNPRANLRCWCILHVGDPIIYHPDGLSIQLLCQEHVLKKAQSCIRACLWYKQRSHATLHHRQKCTATLSLWYDSSLEVFRLTVMPAAEPLQLMSCLDLCEACQPFCGRIAKLAKLPFRSSSADECVPKPLGRC